MRHDAAAFRQNAKSELIRRSLGLETGPEKEQRIKRDRERELEKAKNATKGSPLFIDEGPDDFKGQNVEFWE